MKKMHFLRSTLKHQVKQQQNNNNKQQQQHNNNNNNNNRVGIGKNRPHQSPFFWWGFRGIGAKVR